MLGLNVVMPAASAAPVYEIKGDWETGTPGTVAKGDVVTGIFRVNVNDDAAAPSNEPVDNVMFTVTLQHGQFKGIPDVCLTTGAGLDPVSSISGDGLTLTCNLGSVKQGTAVVVQTPIVADGATGDQLSAVAAINGQEAPLSPINIRNTFGMDMLWGTPTGTIAFGENDAIRFDFEWTLFQDVGSDAGPDTITYDLNIPLGTGQELFPSLQQNSAPWDQPCVPFQNSNSAEGHPYSSPTNYGGVEKNAPFVESCTLTKTGPNTFRMTISGIDYSQTKVPTLDSAGNPMPTDQVAVASGAIWLEVRGLTESTSANLRASAPTYRSVTGQTDPDETANNTSSKVITFPGTWSHVWLRTTGGTNWDNTFKLAPGATVTSATSDNLAATDVPANTVMADCDVLDTRFTVYQRASTWAWVPGDPVAEAPGLGTLQWYVGNDPTVTPGSGGYNPDAFTGCASNTGWVNTEPADKSTVKAVRWTSTAGEVGNRAFQLRVTQTIKEDAPIGQDIWTWGSYLRNGTWIQPGREGSGAVYTPTPGERYSATNGARDILHVVYAVPAISKRADRAIVRPGVPATYTLTYTANGSGAIPETVDDYRIVDTLPVGMTYVAGSADPEPTVTTNAGRQVLTWDLDDVPTNTRNTLTYQAVAGNSVTPGQTLTNTVTSSLRGETSRPASAQVTTSSSGSTEISKSADTPFIPNTDGAGNGAGSWTVSVRSFDPLPQAFTDTIDILPFEGDGRGTDFDGSYSVTSVDALDGQTVYYTDADPATLSDDPAADGNGAAGAPSSRWSTTKPAKVTAVRVVGPALAPGAQQQFRVHIATSGAHGEDVYVNRAQGRAGHTELVMRTSAPMTVANYYSASLKKYVQGRDGQWHDANDVADYPVFRYGDTVKYRIVVTNTGQGKLTNLNISDDKQPELGAFHVDSLAPGESAQHEYSITLEQSTSGTVVNTASATADTPPDSKVPPTINTDPAGFEVANYVVSKSSDPKPGSTVYPGQKVTYTVTVAQQGSVPAAASFSDDLSKVLDDASYNGDVKASVGTAEFRQGHLAWSGTVPVGEQATVTYSVTVKSLKAIKAKGNFNLKNVVTSDGCADECSTSHHVGRFDLKVKKSVLGTSRVVLGDQVRYRIEVTNRGPDAAPAPIKVTDRLPKGLELLQAKGKGWRCTVDKRTDRASCVRDKALAPKQAAAPITVVTKPTKAALGRRVVNVARVSAAGDTVASNNKSVAAIRVTRAPVLPHTGFRIPLTW